MIRPGGFPGGLRVFEQLARDENVTRSALVVYGVMALVLCGPDGVCRHSLARIAGLCRVNRRTVLRALRLFDGVVLERRPTGLGQPTRDAYDFVPLLEPGGGRPLSAGETESVRDFQEMVLDPAATYRDLIAALEGLERICWRASAATTFTPPWPESWPEWPGSSGAPLTGGAQALPVSQEMVDACFAIFVRALKPQLNALTALVATLIEQRSPPAPPGRPGTARRRLRVIQGGKEPGAVRPRSDAPGGAGPRRPANMARADPPDRSGDR